MVTVNHVEFGGRDFNCALARDISEQKQAERERNALEGRVRQQQKLESIGTLAGGVAHEINNPITGIMNYAQLIKDRLAGSADGTVRDYAGEIIHESERIARIVRSLLQFARHDDEQHLPSDAADLVETTLSLIGTVIRGDRTTLEVDVPHDLPRVVCCSQQVEQILMNLLTNARDALNERYPSADDNKVLRVEAHAVENAGRHLVRITVEDRGCGISEEIRGRIFDPFFTTKRPGRGIGLGLSVSHRIATENGGELSVESKPGEYTRFHLDLPALAGSSSPGSG